MNKGLTLEQIHQFGAVLMNVAKQYKVREESVPRRSSLFKFFCCCINDHEKQIIRNYSSDHHIWKKAAEALSGYQPEVYDLGEAWFFLLKHYNSLCKQSYDPDIEIQKISDCFKETWGTAFDISNIGAAKYKIIYKEETYHALLNLIHGHFPHYAPKEIESFARP